MPTNYYTYYSTLSLILDQCEEKKNNSSNHALEHSSTFIDVEYIKFLQSLNELNI